MIIANCFATLEESKTTSGNSEAKIMENENKYYVTMLFNAAGNNKNENITEMIKLEGNQFNLISSPQEFNIMSNTANKNLHLT